MTQGLINPATTSRKRVCQVKEVTRGVTPTNPAWKTLPILEDTNLDSGRTFERSAQIKSNRMGGQQIGGTQSVGGPIALPVKNDTSLRDLLESAFSGTFAAPTLNGAVAGLAFATNGTNASGTILFTANPTAGDTVTINDVMFTFSANPALITDVAIGAATTNTVDNLVAVLSAYYEASVKLARYSKVSTSTLKVEYKTAGTAGNAFTLAFALVGQGQLNGGAAATSGTGTLTGGAGTPDRITDSALRLRTTGFRAGQRITVTGSTTTGNNQTYKITAVATDGSWMELDRDIATAEAFASGTTMTSNAMMLKAGVTRPTFTHEVAYLDLTPVVYEYYRGNEVNDGSIEMPTSGEATITMNMVGTDHLTTLTSFPLGSGTRAAVEDEVSMAGSVSGATVIRDYAETFDAESVTVTFNNNREAKYGTGSELPRFVDQGDFDSEIQASIYFTSPALRFKFLAGTRMNIAVQLEEQRDGDRLLIEYPRAVVTAAPKGKSGNAVTEQVTWFAEEDPVQGTKALVWLIPQGGQ